METILSSAEGDVLEGQILKNGEQIRICWPDGTAEEEAGLVYCEEA